MSAKKRKEERGHEKIRKRKHIPPVNSETNNRRSPREIKIAKALELLKQKNPFIVKFHQSILNGELDSGLKIDLLIFLKNGVVIPLQVKGSKHRELENHYRIAPFITVITTKSSLKNLKTGTAPTIQINRNDSLEKIASLIETAIHAILSQPFEKKMEESVS